MKSKVFPFNQLGSSHTGVRKLKFDINEWLADQPSITIEFINSSENFVIIFYSTRKGKLDKLNDI